MVGGRQAAWDTVDSKHGVDTNSHGAAGCPAISARSTPPPPILQLEEMDQLMADARCFDEEYEVERI